MLPALLLVRLAPREVCRAQMVLLLARLALLPTLLALVPAVLALLLPAQLGQLTAPEVLVLWLFALREVLLARTVLLALR